jgi:hypothetical protein
MLLEKMRAELAKKLRKVTDKTLIFTREIPFGKEPDGDPYQTRFCPKTHATTSYTLRISTP